MRWSFVLLLSLSMLIGCRPSAPPPSSGTETNEVSTTTSTNEVVPAAPQPTRVAFSEIPRWTPPSFDRPIRPELAWVAKLNETSQEKTAAQIKEQLAQLAEAIAAKKTDAAILDTMAGRKFRCGSLRPSTSEVLRNERLTVRRSSGADTWSLSGDHTGAEGFGKAIEEFTEPLQNASDITAKFEFATYDLQGPTFSAVVLLQIYARLEAESSLQWNARWTMRWERKEQSLRLESIKVDDFEEISFTGEGGKLFADATSQVLGGTAAWREQLSWGVDDWRWRREKSLAPAVLGWHGVAIGDANGDGLDDLYVCAGDGLPNRLLLQNADGSVRDISQAAGVDWLDSCSSALLVDLDNDGDQDLVVASASELLVQLNDGQGKFALAQSIALTAQPTSIAAADYDNDGRLDIFVCGFAPQKNLEQSLLGMPSSLTAATNGGANVLLRNEANGVLRDVTDEVGLGASSPYFSLTCGWDDFDRDGDVDLFVGNFCGPNQLYRNDSGNFVDVARDVGLATRGATLSLAWSDLNGDGRSDLYLGGIVDTAAIQILRRKPAAGPAGDTLRSLRESYRPSNLLAVDGQRFRDVPTKERAVLPHATWGVRTADVNNDGYDDLLASTGTLSGVDGKDVSSYFWRRLALLSQAKRPLAWQTISQLVEQGASWSGGGQSVCLLSTPQTGFANASSVSGIDFAGDGRAIATTDLDNDGDLDVWLTSRSAPSLRFAENRAAGQYVAFRLQGVTCNRDAVGARATLTLKPSRRQITQTLRGGDGFLAQSSKQLHFGLPAGEEIESLAIAWPGGTVEERFSNLKSGQAHLVVQGTGKATPIAARDKVQFGTKPSPIPTPPASARIPLVSRIPLPEIKYRELDGTSSDISSSSGRTTLIYLWAASVEPSVDQLKVVAEGEKQFRDANIRVVALTADEIPIGKLVSPATEAAVVKACYFGTVGSATPKVLNTLDAVQQSILALARPLVVPSAILVDKHGRVAALYRGAFTVEEIIQDAAAPDEDDQQRRNQAVGFTGQWRSEPRSINPFVLAERLAAGDDDDVTLSYTQQLIKRGHDRAVGFDELEPDKLYFLLGSLLEFRRRDKDAAEAYRMVLRVDPEHSNSRRRLAEIFARLGQFRESANELQLLVSAYPDDIPLRYEWAVALADAGEIRESLNQHREVLRRSPGAIAAANNLAWLLATNPDPEIRRSEEALQIARKVCEATDYARPDTLDTLAAAYASAGRIEGAVTTARRALELAREQKQSKAQIEAIEYHLQAYEAGNPFYEDPQRQPNDGYSP